MEKIIEFCVNSQIPFKLELNSKRSLFIKINNEQEKYFDLNKINFDEFINDIDYQFTNFIEKHYE